MEEEKAAAYYNDLTRRGEGAARFKQGLGFSSSNTENDPPARASALPTFSLSSSFLSNFVKASSTSIPAKESESELHKQSQLDSIKNKLKKKEDDDNDNYQQRNRVSRREDEDREDKHHRHRSRERHSIRRSRSRDRDRDRDRRRRKSRSRSGSPTNWRARRRSRSGSPRERRMEKERSDYGSSRSRREVSKVEKVVDHSQLIEGYDKMTPAERVKAKMKLQLADTAKKDKVKGSGWERFEFDKDAPLEEEDVQAAEDDAPITKRIGQSFRFSAIEAKREEQIKAAHDEAMFGAPVISAPSVTDDVVIADGENEQESSENAPVASLLSEKVLAKQQGSWRDRARNKRN